MNTPDELLRLVNQYIDSMTYDRRPFSLYEPIQYVLSLGGKRIRPVLMLMSYNMYQPQPEDILSVAVGLETYHNYTLLHDDLMDNASVRRGRPTVHKRWDENTAILSGDTMLVMAYKMISQAPSEYASRVLDIFTETALQISEGQQMDMDFERRNDVSESEYLEMIRLKTSVLLACALKMGAVMGGAADEDADLLYRYGERIGLAFQLQDDFLDVYGDPAVFGKAIGGDIMENKKTFMLINVMLKANAQQREELDGWIAMQNPPKEEKIAAITGLYTEIGVDKMAQERIRQYFAEAESLLDSVDLPEERKSALRSMAAKMLRRNS